MPFINYKPDVETVRRNFKAVIETIERSTTLGKTLDIANEQLGVLAETKQQILKILDHIDTIQIQGIYLERFNEMAQGYLSSLNIAITNSSGVMNQKQELESRIDILEAILIDNHNTLFFFETIGFSIKNIVAIGANGSGKTTLSNTLKRYLRDDGILISAQKLLTIPKFDQIKAVAITASQLIDNQKQDKSMRSNYHAEAGFSGNMMQIFNEFKVLLDHLIAERNEIRSSFLDSYDETTINGPVPKSNLDKAILIWNSLFPQRELLCVKSTNLEIKPFEGSTYPANQMSDGEKAALYMITQVLQAPEKGFVIVDEPEIYLHPTVVKRIWDILEIERRDCIFVYLTHNLDFATSRILAKKIWVRSFNFPDQWELESIPDNELPEALLLELLGSAKSILFCEGERGKNDEKVYTIFFSKLTIIPVGSCSNVISYTKAFNKIKNTRVTAYGLIDSDFRTTQELNALKTERIFSIQVAEIENLFLNEDFLRDLLKINPVLSPQIESTITSIKSDVIELLRKQKEQQASKFVSHRIDFYFKQIHDLSGNLISEVKDKFNDFKTKIKIEDWYTERETFLNDITVNQDYDTAIKVFNNKGLQQIVEKALGIRSFIGRAIQFAETHKSALNQMIGHFPSELQQFQ